MIPLSLLFFAVLPAIPPQCPDADCDGICDIVEDANQNGIWDPGETNPLDADTDDDGLGDGEEQWLNNFLNLMVDPLVFDTDGDGLGDGMELGKDLTNISLGCNGNLGTDLLVFVPDADPSTTTSPVRADSDGGGAADNVEDFNLNGAYEWAIGETDPDHSGDDNPNFQVGKIFSPGTTRIFVKNQPPGIDCIPVWTSAGSSPGATPAPNLGVTFDLIKPLKPLPLFVVWSSGSAFKDYTVPPGLPSGKTIWFQGYFRDPNNPGTEYVETVAWVEIQ
ncbi:MAG: hypothetical protein COB96_05120 [Planctomycetota bacterium]|nr:MAG: hypothetical protein COB96_05120 [Planctomycetota bacterium]